jgi:hypothetical protein
MDTSSSSSHCVHLCTLQKQLNHQALHNSPPHAGEFDSETRSLQNPISALSRSISRHCTMATTTDTTPDTSTHQGGVLCKINKNPQPEEPGRFEDKADDTASTKLTQSTQGKCVCVICKSRTNWMVCKTYGSYSFMDPYCVCCWPPEFSSERIHYGANITHYRWNDVEHDWTKVTSADMADAKNAQRARAVGDNCC